MGTRDAWTASAARFEPLASHGVAGCATLTGVALSRGLETKEDLMDALRCDACGTPGTPATMSRLAVHEEPSDGRVDYVIVCAKHAHGEPTLVELDELPEPTDLDLDAAVATIAGDAEFEREWAAAAEVGEQDAALEGRELSSFERLQYGSAVVLDWWQGGAVEWSRTLSPVDGSMYLVLADNDNTPEEG